MLTIVMHTTAIDEYSIYYLILKELLSRKKCAIYCHCFSRKAIRLFFAQTGITIKACTFRYVLVQNIKTRSCIKIIINSCFAT